MSQNRLNARLRAIKLWGLALLLATGIAWLAWSAARVYLGGLFVGEIGGAYVVVSLIAQGHRNDNMAGTALMATGMATMFTRMLVLIAVMVVAEYWRAHLNPYTALIGYLLGFVFIFVGLYGLAKNLHTDS